MKPLWLAVLVAGLAAGGVGAQGYQDQQGGYGNGGGQNSGGDQNSGGGNQNSGGGNQNSGNSGQSWGDQGGQGGGQGNQGPGGRAANSSNIEVRCRKGKKGAYRCKTDAAVQRLSKCIRDGESPCRFSIGLSGLESDEDAAKILKKIELASIRSTKGFYKNNPAAKNHASDIRDWEKAAKGEAKDGRNWKAEDGGSYSYTPGDAEDLLKPLQSDMNGGQ